MFNLKNLLVFNDELRRIKDVKGKLTEKKTPFKIALLKNMLLLFFLIIIALKSLIFYELYNYKGLKSGLKLAEINNFNEGTLAVYEA